MSVFNAGGQRNKAGPAVAIRTPYLRVLGIHVESVGSGRAATTFTPQEEEHFVQVR
jgi:DNA replication licensing factor MCM5